MNLPSLNNPLISNPFNATPIGNTLFAQSPQLGLTQIEGYEPVQNFTDNSNTQWSLAKASSNSTVGIPDPKTVQIVDYWNHKFPRTDLSKDVYVYVVEGVKQPTVETERPTRVLYQWFSTTYIAAFAPDMITEQEWRKANVYSAPVVESRTSKLLALCRVESGNGQAPAQSQNAEPPLIQVKELSNADTNTEGHQKPSRRGN